MSHLAPTLALLASLTSAPAPQESAPLLTRPEGWPGERIDFPPAFAPDLRFDGYEELAFAPGMFEPASEGYFSYAFGIHIEGEETVDAAWLESFLDRYYKGLCSAVSAGRELDVDPDRLAAIRAQVVPGGHGFVGSIELFDPFTTGEDLRLQVAIEAHTAHGVTELLTLASPHPGEAPIWAELDAIARDWRTRRPDQALLNHVFVVLDEATYRALAESELLGSLGAFEERTTARPDVTYTGLYAYGRHTYFEFLAPDEAGGLPPGSSGVGFGFERPGGTERMAARLRAAGLESVSVQRSRPQDETQVPWFTALGVAQAQERDTGSASGEPRLELFSLEYDPGFLANWHGDLGPQVEGDARLARRPVLHRYAARLEALEPWRDGLFLDVVEVELTLDVPERERVVETSRAFGHRIADGAGATRIDAPGYRLALRPRGPDEAGGVTGFTLSLARPVPSRTVELGRLAVTFEGRRTSFRLRAP